MKFTMNKTIINNHVYILYQCSDITQNVEGNIIGVYSELRAAVKARLRAEQAWARNTIYTQTNPPYHAIIEKRIKGDCCVLKRHLKDAIEVEFTKAGES